MSTFSGALRSSIPNRALDCRSKQVKTKSGTGVMIEEVYGPGKIAAIWSGSDRVYALFPSEGEVTKEFVVKVADALD